MIKKVERSSTTFQERPRSSARIELALLFIFSFFISALLVVGLEVGVSAYRSGNVAGTYTSHTDTVRLYPSGMSPEYYHRACMHEYGHYVWDEQMNEDDREFYEDEEEYAQTWESWQP